MNKLFKKFVLLIMIVFLTTGCMKQHVNMEIKGKKVYLEMIMAMGGDRSELEETPEEEETEEECLEEDGCFDTSEDEELGFNVEDFKDREAKGYKVEEYIEDTKDTYYKGVKLSKTFKNIDDLTTDEKIVVDFSEIVGDDAPKNPMFFYKNGDNYVANFVFDFRDETSEDGYNSELLDDEEIKALYDSMDLQYTVTLPEKPKSHNATSVSKDGKTLTWVLDPLVKNTIEYEFNLGISHLIPNIVGLFVGIGIIVLFALSTFAKNISMMRNAKPASSSNAKPDLMLGQPMMSQQVVPPVMPQQPVMPQPQQPVMPQPQQPMVSQQPMMGQPMQQGMPQQPMMGQQQGYNNQQNY